MTEATSPTYRQGLTDGWADSDRIRHGSDPIGPQPPYPEYPVMYLRGYRATFRATGADHGSAEPYNVDMNAISA